MQPPRSDDSSEVIPVPLGCQRMLRPPAADARWRGLGSRRVLRGDLGSAADLHPAEHTARGHQLLRRSRHLPIPEQPRAWPSRSCPAPRAPAAWTRTRPRAPRCPASTSQPSGPGCRARSARPGGCAVPAACPYAGPPAVIHGHSRTASSGLELCSRRSSDRGHHLCKQGSRRRDAARR